MHCPILFFSREELVGQICAIPAFVIKPISLNFKNPRTYPLPHQPEAKLWRNRETTKPPQISKLPRERSLRRRFSPALPRSGPRHRSGLFSRPM